MNVFSTVLQFIFRHFFVLACWVIWADLTFFPEFFYQKRGNLFLLGKAIFIFSAMLGCVFIVVRYADKLAEMLREPYGTLVLTLTATIIEVSLMLTIMGSGMEHPTLLRETIFATLMVLLNGIVGISLAAGGFRHMQQGFNLQGALSYMHLIVPLNLIILILPNYTKTSAGPTLGPAQAFFVGAICVCAYSLFLILQTTRHKSMFIEKSQLSELHTGNSLHANEKKSILKILGATAGLTISIIPITLLGEHMGEFVNSSIVKMGAPTAIGGLMVTVLVLAPEGLSAIRAALANHMQRAVNICLGSTLSTIALTVPSILIAAGIHHHDILLGIDGVNQTLLYATLLVSIITFVSGKSNMLQGVVHLMLFATYLFFIVFP